jgi:TRAP-type transport system periplasmic protein
MKSFLLSLLLAVCACLVPRPLAAAPFVMKISNSLANDTSNDWMRAVKQGVERRSNGRVRVELYPSNQLGQLAAAVEGVAMGTIELAIAPTGFIGLEPRLQLLDSAGLFDDVEHAARVLGDPEVRRMLASMGASKGVEPLFAMTNNPLCLLSQRPVRALADLKGMKVRAPGGSALHVEPLRAFGASPVVLSLGELLPAMQNRTIDGMIAGFSVYTQLKYYDIATELTELPQSYLVAVGLVNRAFMRSLGPELEGIVREEARNAERLLPSRGAAHVARVRKEWADHGGHVYTLPAADQRTYREQVERALRPLLERNPQMKQDQATLLAASARHRRH